MRFFFDDRDQTFNESRINYHKNHMGFFPEYGDNINTIGNFGKKSMDGYCDNDPDSLQDTFEVVLLFGKDEKLEQMGVVNCTAGRDSNDKIKFPISVYADLREYCTAVAKVHDNTNNAAWTDKLWQNTNNKFTDPKLNYSYKLGSKPMGSLNRSTFNINTADWAWLYSPRQTTNTISAVFGCYGQCGGQADNTKSPPVLDFTKLAPESGLIGSFNTTKLHLSELFAKTLQVFTLDKYKNSAYLTHNSFKYMESHDNEKTFLKDAKDGMNYNYTEIAQDYPSGAESYKHAPQIKTVFNCQSNGKCYEGREGITVNGEPKDGKSNAEVKITSWPAAAVMKFYAFADPNQMPLKQITVSWGDGTTVGPFTGMYRNKRGLTDGVCQSSYCYVTSTHWNTSLNRLTQFR